MDYLTIQYKRWQSIDKFVISIRQFIDSSTKKNQEFQETYTYSKEKKLLGTSEL
jgi:hypothetical protein